MQSATLLFVHAEVPCICTGTRYRQGSRWVASRCQIKKASKRQRLRPRVVKDAMANSSSLLRTRRSPSDRCEVRSFLDAELHRSRRTQRVLWFIMLFVWWPEAMGDEQRGLL